MNYITSKALETIPMKVQLKYTAYLTKQIPRLSDQQIAIAGRSNVGKSSLINCLFNRKNIARSSSIPGKTQSINFYWVLDAEFYLVDLPGYGYAKISKKQRNHLAQLIESYLQNAPLLKAVVILLDCRLKPQDLDLDVLEYLKMIKCQFIPILTKVDKCTMAQRVKNYKIWEDILQSTQKPLLFSAKTCQGKDHIIQKIYQVLNLDQI